MIRLILLGLLIFAVPAHADLTWPNAGGNGVWDASEQVQAADLNAIKTEVDKAITVVSTEAELEAAEAACDAQTCTIYVDGNITTDGITLSSSGAIHLIGLNDAELLFSGTPGPVIDIDGCNGCSIQNLRIDGNDTATYGILADGDTSNVTRLRIVGNYITEIDGTCVHLGGGSPGQVDKAYVANNDLTDCDQSYRQQGNQAVENWFVQNRVSGLNISGEPMVDIEAGGATIWDNGIHPRQAPTSPGETIGIFVDDAANVRIIANRMEMCTNWATGQGAITGIEIGDGGGIMDTRVIQGNFFVLQGCSSDTLYDDEIGAAPDCIHINARGHASLTDNSLLPTTSVRECNITLENTANNGSLYVYAHNNSNRLDNDPSDYEGTPWSYTDADVKLTDIDGGIAEFPAAASPEIGLTSSTGSDQVKIRLIDNGTTTTMNFYVDDGNGDDQLYLQLRGNAEDAIFHKDVLILNGNYSGGHAMYSVTSAPTELVTNFVALVTVAGVQNLPDCTADTLGHIVHVVVRDASETVSIGLADSGDSINYPGITTLAAGDELDSSGAALDSITFRCLEANEWYVTSVAGGAWTDGTP